jgi:DNA-binding transcriptional MocR family regulator
VGERQPAVAGGQRHAGDRVARVTDAPYVPVHPAQGRWAVVRSLSKVLGPDLRLALVAGDPLTTTRIEGRQHLSPGWVSHILQQVAALLLAEEATRGSWPGPSGSTPSAAGRLRRRLQPGESRRRATQDSGSGFRSPRRRPRSASSWFRDGR